VLIPGVGQYAPAIHATGLDAPWPGGNEDPLTVRSVPGNSTVKDNRIAGLAGKTNESAKFNKYTEDSFDIEANNILDVDFIVRDPVENESVLSIKTYIFVLPEAYNCNIGAVLFRPSALFKDRIHLEIAPPITGTPKLPSAIEPLSWTCTAYLPKE